MRSKNISGTFGLVAIILFSVSSEAAPPKRRKVPENPNTPEMTKKKARKKSVLGQAPIMSRWTGRVCNLAAPFTVEKDLQPDNYEYGTLTWSWAQEIVGTDLIGREKLAKKAPHSVQVGVIDEILPINFLPRSAFAKDKFVHIPRRVIVNQTHGVLVTNLILGPSPIAASKAKLGIFASFYGFSERENGIFDEILSRPQVSLFNASVIITRGNFEVFQELINKNKILVLASGNNYPYSGYFENEIKDAIIVGSLNPMGFLSEDSQEGKGVTLVAPSWDSVSSLNQDGKITKFSGTSGAAPQVTGALAVVLSYLPNLSARESKILLQNTATPSWIVQGNGLNGAGILNAYRLVRVAQRIHNSERNGPSRSRIDLLNDPKTYDFADEAQGLLESSGKLLESIKDLTNVEEICSVEFERLTSLRKSYLLHPTEKARELIDSLYSRNGFWLNANFYKSLGEQKHEFVKNELKLIRSRIPNLGASTIRALPLIANTLSPQELNEIMVSILNSNYPEWIISLVGVSDALGMPQIVDVYLNKPQLNDLVLEAIFRMAITKTDWSQSDRLRLIQELLKKGIKPEFLRGLLYLGWPSLRDEIFRVLMQRSDIDWINFYVDVAEDNLNMESFYSNPEFKKAAEQARIPQK